MTKKPKNLPKLSNAVIPQPLPGLASSRPQLLGVQDKAQMADKCDICSGLVWDFSLALFYKIISYFEQNDIPHFSTVGAATSM